MNRALQVVLSLAALSLAGCLDIAEEIWIRPDGTSRGRFDIQVSETLASMGAGREGKNGGFGEFRAKLQEKAKQLAADKEHVNSAKYEEFKEAGKQHYVLDVEANSTSAVADATTDPAGAADAKQTVRFEPGEWGKVKFVCTLGGKASEAAGAEAVSKILFADKQFTLRLHAPRILSSNGNLDEGGQMVEWKLPMAEMIAGGERGPRVLEAVLQTRNWGVMAGVAGALLLLLVVVLSWKKLR